MLARPLTISAVIATFILIGTVGLMYWDVLKECFREETDEQEKS